MVRHEPEHGDPATFRVLASALDKGQSDAQMFEFIQRELQGLNALRTRKHLADHHHNGKVDRVRSGKPIDPQKLAAIRQAKAAGEPQASVSRRLGMPKSTVGRLWHYCED